MCGQGNKRDAYPPPAIFKHILNDHSFSMILNFFGNSKPYTLSTHILIESVRTKCIIFGETLRFRGKKLRQNMPKNCLKSTKMATTGCKFSGGVCPWTPLEPFLFSSCFKVILPENVMLEKYQTLVSLS